MGLNSKAFGVEPAVIQTNSCQAPVQRALKALAKETFNAFFVYAARAAAPGLISLYICRLFSQGSYPQLKIFNNFSPCAYMPFSSLPACLLVAVSLAAHDD